MDCCYAVIRSMKTNLNLHEGVGGLCRLNKWQCMNGQIEMLHLTTFFDRVSDTIAKHLNRWPRAADANRRAVQLRSQNFKTATVQSPSSP